MLRKLNLVFKTEQCQSVTRHQSFIKQQSEGSSFPPLRKKEKKKHTEAAVVPAEAKITKDPNKLRDKKNPSSDRNTRLNWVMCSCRSHRR